MIVSEYDKAFRKGYEAYEQFNLDAVNPYEKKKNVDLSNRWLEGLSAAFLNRNRYSSQAA